MGVVYRCGGVIFVISSCPPGHMQTGEQYKVAVNCPLWYLLLLTWGLADRGWYAGVVAFLCRISSCSPGDMVIVASPPAQL
jgi:hypothetical protein